MTLPVTSRIAGPYSCNGTIDDFDFAFKVFATSDIRVVKTSVADVETVLVLNTDYTVVLNADQENDPGGTVTTSSAYATGFTVTIDGAQTYGQTAELTNLGGFFPKVIERAMDRIVIMIQQLKKLTDRSLKFPVSDSIADTEIPGATQRASRVLGFDADGDITTHPVSLTVYGTVVEEFTATASQTVFNLTRSYVPGVNAVAVFVNGLRLRGGGVDFTETTATRITLTTGAALNDEVVIVLGQEQTSTGSIDASVVGYTPAGSGATATNVQAKLRRICVDVKDFGAAGDGATNDTSAIQAAVTAHNAVLVPDGTYRVDGTITIPDNHTLYLSRNAKLIRLSAHSAATTPVVHLKGTHAVLDGGSVESQNSSPAGVVTLGHLDTTTSNWNSLWWRFSNCDVYCKDFRGDTTTYPIRTITGATQANPCVISSAGHGFSNGNVVQIRDVVGMTQLNNNTYTVANATANTYELSGVNSSGYTAYSSGGVAQVYPGVSDGVGVYIPSSQPELGSSYANYYGVLENITVYNPTTAYWFTDSSNAHRFTNLAFEFIYHYGYRFNGAYGNSGTIGFCNGAYKNGATTFLLADRLTPGAAHTASHESNNNVLYAGAVELYTTGNYGVNFSHADCVGNKVFFEWNTTGTAIADSSAAANTVLTRSDNRFRNLTTSEVLFPAVKVPSSNANALDDYEETEEWTPTLVSTGATITHTVQSGVAVKVGQLVFAQFTITASAAGTLSNPLTMTGLPHTSKNKSNFTAGAAITYTTFAALPTIYLLSNATTGYFATAAGVDFTPTDADLGTSKTVRGFFVYRANA